MVSKKFCKHCRFTATPTLHPSCSVHFTGPGCCRKGPTTTISNLELGDMAREEATFEDINMNQYLASLFHKKLDSIIKYQRKKGNYKAMINGIRADLEDIAEDPLTPPRPDDDLEVSSEDDSVYPNESLARAADTTTLHPPPTRASPGRRRCCH